MGEDEEVCQVCKIPSKLKCTKCNVAVYCSRDHQKQDWKAHKKECWPHAEGFQDEYGKYWIASCDIPAGSIILKECPAISGPYIPTIAKTPKRLQLSLYTEEQQTGAKWDYACLGCNALLTKETKKLCSKCGWPVCSSECEQMPIHSQNECPFFTERKIKYPIQKLTAHNISLGMLLLRGMFLHRRDPVLCGKLISNLQDARSCASSSSGPQSYTQGRMEDYLQIRSAFKAHRYFPDCDDVWSQLYETIPRRGTRDVFKVDGKEIQEASIFPMANMFLRECVPNADQTTRRLSSTPTNLTGSNLQIQIRALCPISKGDFIKISSGQSLDYGTDERMDFRAKLCHPFCTCRRCWDPTELGTYSSAIKCRTCSTGYMLPVRFLINLGAPFICSKCPDKMGRPKVKKIIYQLFQEFLVLEKLVIDGDDGAEGEDGMKKLRKFIGRHSGRTLHPNHWILQQAMLRFCFALTPSFSQNPANIERALTYGRKLIDLTEMITPGLVLEKIELMLRIASYASLDLKLKTSSLSEEDVKKRCVEIHEWASAVLKFWEQEMGEEPGAVTIETKSIEEITEDMTLARNLIQESKEMSLCLVNNCSSMDDVDEDKFPQTSISIPETPEDSNE